MGVSRGLPSRIDGVALYVELQRKSNMSTRVKESVRKGLVYV